MAVELRGWLFAVKCDLKRAASDDTLRCSFCHKSQDIVGKLISSPSDYPRAYICDECIAVCNSILEDDKPKPTTRLPRNQAEIKTELLTMLSDPDETGMLATMKNYIESAPEDELDYGRKFIARRCAAVEEVFVRESQRRDV